MQVPKIAVQERSNMVHVEHVIDIPVPHTVEDGFEAAKWQHEKTRNHLNNTSS